MIDDHHDFVFSAITLAEIKHLIAIKRVEIDFEKVINYLSQADNCIVYPVDEDVIEQMPPA